MGQSSTQYKYGRRPQKMPPSGTYREHRAQWAKFGTFEVVIYLDNSGQQVGGEVILTFYNSRKNWAINLSDCTVADLDAIKEVLDRAFELAYPVAEARDRVAQDDYDRGVDSNPRIYRQLPQRVVRQRVFDEHGPRLPLGPTDIPLLDWHPGSSKSTGRTADELLRSDDGGVAEGHPQGGGSKDDVPPSNKPASLRGVGGYPDPSPGSVQDSDAEAV